MNLNRKMVLVIGLASLTLFSGAFAKPKKEIIKTYDAKESIRIKTVSGDCIVEKGDADKIIVRLEYSIYPEDVFEPEFKERDNSLRLDEEFYGSSSGSSKWYLSVPDGTDIRFSSASGNFSAEGLDLDVIISTASGDIDILDCGGRFEGSTASGNILLEGSRGEFNLSTASGNVDAMETKFEDDCELSSASGDVLVRLTESLTHDFIIRSASGDAVLDYDGNPVKGYFEFVVKYRDGRIKSPFDYDDEEKFRRWGDQYIRKSFTRETDSLEISIFSASGRAELRD
ncbi:MAG: DUF4097 family beta strand repeat-containing protein [candidate division Zixibacteria bacterium]